LAMRGLHLAFDGSPGRQKPRSRMTVSQLLRKSN